ncbi:MAG: mechanosensitive ion channel [Bacteroidetes bacterium]|nr:mechanosensitive ion channel [Bacteroidota bacterium]
METIKRIAESIKELLSIPIFTIGESHLTLWTFLYLTVLFVLLIYLSGKLRTWISDRLFSHSSMHIGMRLTIGTIFRYVLIFIGMLIILQTAGIDLTTLNVLAGTIGIGVGFGLQNIANNFISGIIILIERPIKIGDRIEVGSIEGDVVHIGARSTSVITNDNITIIIPNSTLISENVINWSHNDEKVRFKIPVSVAYGSDVKLVEQLLISVAKEEKEVLEDPKPGVRFMEFGDSGLLFELRAWTNTLTHRKGLLTSKLNFAIYDKFNQNGIQIPFPQRDIHILGTKSEQNTPPTVKE